ncbi:MAG TPA: hypothetical protein VHA30_00180, partial [Patescibacteria group bacterium]|nr:hypothetical protein [Patescibacteria group bacterium]
LAAALGCFEALIAIINLNQPALFIRTAAYVSLFYILQIVLLYDLHFKARGSYARARQRHERVPQAALRRLKILGSAFGERFAHLGEWRFLKTWLNYLILPLLIFWSTITIFYVNFGFYREQQIFALLSAAALFFNYWYLKEIFARGRERVDRDIFIVLSMVKIYAGAIAYGASLAIVRYYCLSSAYLALGAFALTFLLIYQALFQHRLMTGRNLLITLVIAGVMSQLANLVIVYWGYNYFTGAVFLAACYNLMWGIFHYQLDRALTWRSLAEILAISLIIMAMLLSVTNFRARLTDACQYRLDYGVSG